MNKSLFVGRNATAAERVARCRQKQLMMGHRQMTIRLNPEVAKALQSLKEASDHRSVNGIISSLIAEAAKTMR